MMKQTAKRDNKSNDQNGIHRPNNAIDLDLDQPFSRPYYQFTGQDLEDYFIATGEDAVSMSISSDLGPLVTKLEDFLNQRFHAAENGLDPAVDDIDGDFDPY